MGRRMKGETDQRIKVTGQGTVTTQEFFSFCCPNFSTAEIKRVPNLNYQVTIRKLTTALPVSTIASTEQVSVLEKQ